MTFTNVQEETEDQYLVIGLRRIKMTKAQFTKKLMKRQVARKKQQERVFKDYISNQCLDSKLGSMKKRR